MRARMATATATSPTNSLLASLGPSGIVFADEYAILAGRLRQPTGPTSRQSTAGLGPRSSGRLNRLP